MRETQRWVNLGLLLSSGVVFLFFLRAVEFAWEASGFPPTPQDWPVSGSQLAALVLAGAAGTVGRTWSKANQFFNEVALELSKVTWPLRKETVSSSGIVVVLIGISTALLALIDLIWGTMSRGVFR